VEFVAIKGDAVALRPKALSMEEAASIPLVGLTACQAFREADRCCPVPENGDALSKLSHPKRGETP
jgi:NADPH:quinone reductase-like Zn-dependent oxidoreductase